MNPAQSKSKPQFDILGWLRQWRRTETWVAYLFIVPSLIGFLVFFAVPAVRGLVISFTDWDMLRAAKDVGLANYQSLFGDEDFWNALLVTGQYVVWNIPIQTVVAIFLAALMNRLTKSLFIRGALVLPWVLPNVVVALLWLWMLDPQLGLVNQILGIVGIERQPFLGSPDQAIPSIAAINIWRHAGYNALLIFAGLQTIPAEMYEAASIDGASERRMFFSVTLPLLRPVIVFILITTIIGSFQIFDTIAVTTKGGPVAATRVLFWYIYEFAFTRFKMGYASAVAVVLFSMLMTITMIQLRFFRANQSDLS